jgi:nitroimidazol reductase NimA-like FMN-containing flavoprotein (pyridoxamine 5'-phosphate oxidase superfamily)
MLFGYGATARDRASLRGEGINMAECQEHRGRMVRSDRQISDREARDFLRQHAVAHVGTCDASGRPYVVPLMYVYEEGEFLYLHTGPHRGHFLANVGENSRICIEVDEPGALQRGKPSACNSALVYKSVIAYGKVRVMDGADVKEKKTWFFDRLLERLNEPREAYEPGYPLLDRIILFEVALEMLTGKSNVGLHH